MNPNQPYPPTEADNPAEHAQTGEARDQGQKAAQDQKPDLATKEEEVIDRIHRYLGGPTAFSA